MLAQKEYTHENTHKPTVHFDFNKKKEQKPPLINPFVKRRLITFGLIAGIIGIPMMGALHSESMEFEHKQQQKQEMIQQLRSLKEQEKTMKQEIQNLNNDDYIAKLARRDYFLSKKGEVLFQLVGKD